MQKNDISQLIFTTSESSEQAGLDEMIRLLGSMHAVQWLAPGVALLSVKALWPRVASLWGERPPVFVRHICPAQVNVRLVHTIDDVDRLAKLVVPLLSALDPALSFSVQTRLLDHTTAYRPIDVNKRLAGVLAQAGTDLDVRSPGQVLSVVCTERKGYVGLSLARDNLSNWAGGAHRFKRETGQISRAEFKLMEAIDLFDLKLPRGGLALDLGAAPGGWTRQLRRRGMQVVAVDPADLDPSLETDPAVIHVRMLAQKALKGPVLSSRSFDLILNDMRIDARDSARLMLSMAELLKMDSLALMSLKLPTKRMRQTASQALELLRRRFRIIGARQLFHNRNEITVVLSRLR